MTEVEIKADDGCTRIQVLGYERAEFVDESDGDWLRCFVDIEILPFKGGVEASFEVQDFSQLCENLETIYKNLDGEALFAPIEGALSLKFAMKGRGEMTIDGEANPAFPSHVALRFGLHSDQTILKEVVGSLKAVMRQYPSRRKAIPKG